MLMRDALSKQITQALATFTIQSVESSPATAGSAAEVLRLREYVV